VINLLWDVGFAVYLLAVVSPGWALCRAMKSRDWFEDRAESLAFGYGIGLGWAILASVLTRWVHLPPVVLPILSIGLAWYVSRALRQRRSHKRAGWRVFFQENRAAVMLGLIAVVLTAIVILRVGRIEDGQHVYTTLFVNDYFNHMAVTAEVAKNVPPTNIYFHGPTAHYYWFFHAVPAAYYQLCGLLPEVLHLLLILDSLNILFVFLALSVLLRKLRVSRRTVGATLGLVLLCYSYIDLFIIGRAIGNWIGITNMVPALSDHWEKIQAFSGLSHSYMRDFWVEPHAVAGLIFAALTLVMQRAPGKRVPDFVRGLLIGLFVLCAFGCDSFLGAILAAWVGLDTTLDYFYRKDERPRLLIQAGGVGVMAVIGLAYVLGLGMIGGQGGMLRVTPFVGVIATLPFYLTLDYGPIFLLGVAGWWLLWRGKAETANPRFDRVWLLGMLALAAGLFLQHAVEYDIVLRKSGKPLQLALLIGCAVCIERLWHARLRTRAIAIVIALDLQAFGGFAGARGLQNRIPDSEVRALRWIRRNTDKNGVVQGIPGYQGEYLYEINPIPALAQRPVAVGTYMLAALWGVGGGPANERRAEIDAMFETTSIDTLTATLDEYNIRYLYLGPQERQAYDLHPEMLWANQRLFAVEWDEDSVMILRYKGSGAVRRGLLDDEPVKLQP